ncbi:DUF349 domain-containing protein [Glaciecola sp. 1036]|uniref:DUF349 domain-containing protein n=1 Tax=Alteromonadaceae TaxID=72275 RepID=UPI003CFF433B
MIFKQLFTANYKHKNPSKRIQAIQQASEVDNKNKAWLHELAFNDADSKVQLAALEKLGQYSLWLKTYETTLDATLKSRAKTTTISMLEDPSLVSDALFQDFILQAKHLDIIQKLLRDSSRLASNSALYFSALLAHGSQSEIFRYYRESASPSQQIMIIEQFNDEKSLKRLRKQAANTEVEQEIDNRLAQFAEQALIPVQLKRDITLINSQLLALLDSNDFAYIKQKSNQYFEAFEAAKLQFSYLDEKEAAEFGGKFLQLKQKITNKLANLEPAFEQQVKLKALTNELSLVNQQVLDIETQVSHLINATSLEQIDVQKELLTNALQDANSQLAQVLENAEQQTPAHQQLQKSISQRIKSTLSSLDSIEKSIRNNNRLVAIIDTLENVWLEFSNHNLSKEVLSEEFGLAKKGFIQDQEYAPELLAKWKQLSRQINAFFQQEKQQQQQVEKKCHSKLNVAASLIDQGKFKAGIATFNHGASLFSSIESPKRSLQKKYDDLASQVSELKDWQSYIATPKKPELLEQAENLSKQETLNPLDLAQQIKLLRKEWNSLGRLDTEEDDKLNKAFNEKLEIAFAPCRAFYAEQEKLRVENGQKAQQIIDSLAALGEQEDLNQMAKQLHSLSRQFREIKELDVQQKKSLNKAFKETTTPLNERLNEFYADNHKQKSALVSKAKDLLSEDDANQAVEKAKELQANWKLIGFAGKQADQSLWNEFRTHNDAIFSRLHQAKNEAEQQAREALDIAINQLQSLGEEAKNVDDAATLRAILQQVIDHEFGGIDVSKSILSQYEKHKESLIKSLKQSLEAQQQAQSQSIFNELLSCLHEWKADDNNKAKPALLSAILDKSLPTSALFDNLQRAQLLQAVVVLLNAVESAPIEIQKDVQLQIMANKLEGAENLTASVAWMYWLHQGPLNAEDERQLTAIEPLLLSHLSQLM